MRQVKASVRIRFKFVEAQVERPHDPKLEVFLEGKTRFGQRPLFIHHIASKTRTRPCNRQWPRCKVNAFFACNWKFAAGSN